MSRARSFNVKRENINHDYNLTENIQRARGERGLVKSDGEYVKGSPKSFRWRSFEFNERTSRKTARQFSICLFYSLGKSSTYVGRYITKKRGIFGNISNVLIRT